MTATVTDFEVRRDTLADTRVEQHGVPEPGEGQVLMKVDLFSLTANNITYAVFGEAMRYWDFFSDAGAWGRVPVWGFGDVVASRHAGVAEGTRVYGYFPMATHRLAEPGRADAGGFVDVSGARGELAPVYSQYMATGADPLYAREDEDQIMLFRPLFTTSFILDDWLAENRFFGARRVILSSASSKTSLGLAFLLKTTRGDNVRVAGLTSAGNRAFVEGTGCYDEVIGYDEIEGLDAGTPAAFVDMAGNSSVRARVHTHFKDALKLSSAVGAPIGRRSAAARRGCRDRRSSCSSRRPISSGASRSGAARGSSRRWPGPGAPSFPNPRNGFPSRTGSARRRCAPPIRKCSTARRRPTARMCFRCGRAAEAPGRETQPFAPRGCFH